MIALLFAAALAASPTPAPAATGQGAPVQAGSAATSAAAAADAYTAQEVAYARTSLPMNGWTLLSATRDLIIFSKGVPASPIAKLWVRGEHYPLGPENPLGAGESFVTSYEIDCPGSRSRTLSSTIYSGAKMQGSIIAASDKTGEWTPLKAGGFTSMGADAVCAKAAPLAKDGAALTATAGKPVPATSRP